MNQPRAPRSQQFAKKQNTAPTSSLVHLRSARASDEDVQLIVARLEELYDDASEIVRCGEDAFFSDRIRLHAAVGLLIQIGETAAHLPQPFVAAHDDLPYRAMIKMRHKLAHALGDIEWTIVWRALSLEIPEVALKQRRALIH